MSRKRLTIDKRPGPLPDIRAEGDSITYALALEGIAPGLQLVIRCDAKGEVWVSAVADPPHTR